MIRFSIKVLADPIAEPHIKRANREKSDRGQNEDDVAHRNSGREVADAHYPSLPRSFVLVKRTPQPIKKTLRPGRSLAKNTKNSNLPSPRTSETFSTLTQEDEPLAPAAIATRRRPPSGFSGPSRGISFALGRNRYQFPTKIEISVPSVFCVARISPPCRRITSFATNTLMRP